MSRAVNELIWLRISKSGPGVGEDQAQNRGPRSLGQTTAARYPDQSIRTATKGVNVSGSNPDPY